MNEEIILFEDNNLNNNLTSILSFIIVWKIFFWCLVIYSFYNNYFYKCLYNHRLYFPVNKTNVLLFVIFHLDLYIMYYDYNN